MNNPFREIEIPAWLPVIEDKPLTECQKIKALLSPIPEDQWLTDAFTDGQGKCCAIGHLMRLQSSNPSDYGIGNCRDDIHFNDGSRYHRMRHISFKFYGFDFAYVNNMQCRKFPQPTPKARVMAALDELIKCGN